MNLPQSRFQVRSGGCSDPAAVATALWDKVPMRLPPSAMLPNELAERVLDIIDQGQSGIIDVTAK